MILFDSASSLRPLRLCGLQVFRFLHRRATVLDVKQKLVAR
jgi:hypothetical protein